MISNCHISVVSFIRILAYIKLRTTKIIFFYTFNLIYQIKFKVEKLKVKQQNIIETLCAVKCLSLSWDISKYYIMKLFYNKQLIIEGGLLLFCHATVLVWRTSQSKREYCDYNKKITLLKFFFLLIIIYSKEKMGRSLKF